MGIELTIPDKEYVTLEDMRKAMLEHNAGTVIEVGDELLVVATKSITITAGDKNGA